ncbi:MAG TPA: DUF2017 family protein [Acidimicrobiia bacterium]|nr:DUF2017 family protein [Acidimicrobiia bacterium]
MIFSAFKRNRRGELVARLRPEEVELLRSLPDELRPVVDAPPASDTAGDGDAVRQRLFPRAYLDPTEEQAESDWQGVVHPELVRTKLEALSLLTTTLDRATTTRGRVEVVLTPEESEAWLGVLNDARLALGVALGVTEELDYRTIRPDDPSAAAYGVYGWLTSLQGQLIDALAAS